jgi:hypothetical protein
MPARGTSPDWPGRGTKACTAEAARKYGSAKGDAAKMCVRALDDEHHGKGDS